MRSKGRVKVGVVLLGIVALGAAGAAAIAHHRTAPSLAGRGERMSYALGLDLGAAARKAGIAIDADLAARGLADALSGDGTMLSDEEARAALLELQVELKAKRVAAERDLAEKNGRDGAVFRAAFAKQEGAVTLASGLQYKVLKEGDGKRPTDADVVECSYRGTRIDGTALEGSERSGGRARLPVMGLIPGWREAVKLMPVGSRWQLVIPPALGYGAASPRHAPGVGPNATLVYDVELLAAEPAPPGGAARAAPRAAARARPTGAR